jgi:sulfatase maturation enzyme AslB (radical SAM superfamily)
MKNSDWSLKDFQNIVLPVADQLIKINFCGNFGDPLLNINLQLMTDLIKNKNIHVDVHTNGSLRNNKWWASFPKHLPASHRVVFGIDGLADTHQIYRVGTDFERILENAKTFIHASGIAEWCFIKFKHNEHQIEEARQLAKKYGFKYFSVKDSSRFNFEKQFAVYDKYGKTLYYLEPPSASDTKYFDAQDLNLIKNLVDTTKISCYAKHQTELYIDAHRRIMPCCFLAAIPYDYYRKNDSLSRAKDIVKLQYKKLVQDLGDTTGSIQSVLESESFQTVWEQYWTINKLWTCARTCGDKFNKPNDQIQSYHVL